jgi:hypothetical protein
MRTAAKNATRAPIDVLTRCHNERSNQVIII